MTILIDPILFFNFYLMHREKQLNALMRLYDEHETEMCDVLAQDLRKSRQESIINEVELLRNDLRNLLMNLKEYAKPEKVRGSLLNRIDTGMCSFKIFHLSNFSPKKRLSICWTMCSSTKIRMALLWLSVHGIIHFNWHCCRWQVPLPPEIVWW